MPSTHYIPIDATITRIESKVLGEDSQLLSILDQAITEQYGGEARRKVLAGRTSPTQSHALLVLETDPSAYGGVRLNANSSDDPQLRKTLGLSITSEYGHDTLKMVIAHQNTPTQSWAAVLVETDPTICKQDKARRLSHIEQAFDQTFSEYYPAESAW